MTQCKQRSPVQVLSLGMFAEEFSSGIGRFSDAYRWQGHAASQRLHHGHSFDISTDTYNTSSYAVQRNACYTGSNPVNAHRRQAHNTHHISAPATAAIRTSQLVQSWCGEGCAAMSHRLHCDDMGAWLLGRIQCTALGSCCDGDSPARPTCADDVTRSIRAARVSIESISGGAHLRGMPQCHTYPTENAKKRNGADNRTIIDWKKSEGKIKTKFADLHQLASAMSSGKAGAVLDYELRILSVFAVPPPATCMMRQLCCAHAVQCWG